MRGFKGKHAHRHISGKLQVFGMESTPLLGFLRHKTDTQGVHFRTWITAVGGSGKAWAATPRRPVPCCEEATPEPTLQHFSEKHTSTEKSVVLVLSDEGGR